MFTKYNKIAHAVIKTVNDERMYEQRQDLSIDDNLVEPVITDHIFDRNIAIYASDLIARVQILFQNGNIGTNLTLPDVMANKKILYYNNKILGFIGKSQNKNQVWIVFRGTADKLEWRHDLQFNQNMLKDLNLNCHSGFLEIYKSFRADVKETLNGIENIADCKILLCGYSLGGALATISSFELSKLYDNIYVYVFGCPRVCESVPISCKSFWRINNTEDIIKDIPLPIMPNLKKVDKPLIYTHVGSEKNFTENLNSLSANHRLQLYISALNKLEI